MVTEEIKWLLANTKIDPKNIADVWGIPENECWEYLSLLDGALNEAEVDRQSTSETRRLEVQEFAKSITEGREVRRKIVLERLNDAKRHPTRYDIPALLREAKSFATGDVESITESDILRAKAVSISEMLNVTRKGNISCPFHKDKNPSFQITKKNTFTCHSCGVFGDSIDLYRKLNNCDFKTAVKALQ